MNKYIVGGLIFFLFLTCKPRKNVVSLKTLADTAAYFSQQIATLEKNLDFHDSDSFLATSIAIQMIKNHADSVIQAYFTEHNNDTLFLSFDQSKNIEKFKIQKLWAVGATYNQLLIEAQIYAMDNSSFKGPYTSLAIKQKNESRLECGGGIGANDTIKLRTGEMYIFTGTINKLSALSQFRTILFDEPIKKW
jgi:hypothetical protein